MMMTDRTVRRHQSLFIISKYFRSNKIT